MPELPILIRKAAMRDAAAICAGICGLATESGS